MGANRYYFQRTGGMVFGPKYKALQHCETGYDDNLLFTKTKNVLHHIQASGLCVELLERK
jgi:hypothetical protein